ncbi:MAG: DUF3784 domain-containing protein [Ruminococcus sp.]|nr:DUF3784 domain-containing protein [Ruminococcus sp.]
MVVAFIIFFLIFAVLSVLSFMGKFNSLITGNKTDEEGNPVYDDKALRLFLGLVMLMLAVSALMGILGYLISSLSFLVICAPVLFVAVLIFALVYANDENRFKRKKRGRRYRK